MNMCVYKLLVLRSKQQKFVIGSLGKKVILGSVFDSIFRPFLSQEINLVLPPRLSSQH